MTTEQLELLHASNRVLEKLATATRGELPRPVLFALSAFVVGTCVESGTTQEQFLEALRASWALVAKAPQ